MEVFSHDFRDTWAFIEESSRRDVGFVHLISQHYARIVIVDRVSDLYLHLLKTAYVYLFCAFLLEIGQQGLLAFLVCLSQLHFLFTFYFLVMIIPFFMVSILFIIFRWTNSIDFILILDLS